jgi:hypothetical protein
MSKCEPVLDPVPRVTHVTQQISKVWRRVWPTVVCLAIWGGAAYGWTTLLP